MAYHREEIYEIKSTSFVRWHPKTIIHANDEKQLSRTSIKNKQQHWHDELRYNANQRLNSLQSKKIFTVSNDINAKNDFLHITNNNK